MKILLFIIFCSTASFAEIVLPNPDEITNCLTTREFVTALEFLRSDEDFKLKEADARNLAYKIAEGCTGAAKRFIRISKSLTKSGANRKNAIDTALKFSSGTDAETDAFNTAFRSAIAEDGLDLDFESSLKIALSLSKEFTGNLDKVRKDFEIIVNYCSNTNELALPKTQCGMFAASLAKKGESWRDGIADSFIKSFKYLSSEKGPALVTHDALKIAESLVSQGPEALENFTQSYQYGTSSNGLALPRDEAIKFAKKMASITTKIEEPKVTQVKGKHG